MATTDNQAGLALASMGWAECALAALAANPDLKRTTVYISPKQTVKATRHHRPGHSKNATFLVTVGTPNYAEKRFIENCVAAGEPFPVKKMQYKFYPIVKRKASARKR